MQDADAATEMLVADFWETNPGPHTAERFEELVAEGAELLEISPDIVRYKGERLTQVSQSSSQENESASQAAEVQAEGPASLGAENEPPTTAPLEVTQQTPQAEEAQEPALTEKPQTTTTPGKEDKNRHMPSKRPANRPSSQDFVKSVWAQTNGYVPEMVKAGEKAGFNFNAATLYVAKSALEKTGWKPTSKENSTPSTKPAKKDAAAPAAKKSAPSVKLAPPVPTLSPLPDKKTPGQIIEALYKELAEAEERVDDVKSRLRAALEAAKAAL